MTVAQTIQEITREHLTKNKCLALGQCLTAVGWVGGTVPVMREEDGLIELPMADVSGSGIAVGLALAKRRPIYIVRYQGFQWYNAVTVVNYAAKSKDMWGIPCPVFVRSIAMDGGIGPVAGNSHHSLITRMPGITVCAPMTPDEYRAIWKYFMSHDDPMYVSEHRKSFSIDYEMKDTIVKRADITLFAISSTRLSAIEAQRLLQKEGIYCNIVQIVWLKPFRVTESIKNAVNHSKYGGIILDGDFENGIAKCIAADIMLETKNRIHVLGLEERTAGFAPDKDNLPPSTQRIIAYIHAIIKSKYDSRDKSNK